MMEGNEQEMTTDLAFIYESGWEAAINQAALERLEDWLPDEAARQGFIAAEDWSPVDYYAMLNQCGYRTAFTALDDIFDPLSLRDMPHHITSGAHIVYAEPRHNPLEDILVTSEQMAGRQPRPREFFIENLMPKYRTTLLYGDGGVGKSRLARQLHADCGGILDEPWIGKTLLERGPSIIFTCEDEENDVHNHLLEMCDGDNRTLARAGIDIVDLTLYKERALFDIDRRTGNLVETDTFKWAADLILRKPYVLVTWDSKNALYRGNDISGAHADDCAHAMDDIAREAKVTSSWLAHPSQSGMASGKGTGGHSNWHNSFRSRLYFEKDAHDPTLRKFSQMKGNYAADDSFSCFLRTQGSIFVPVERTNGIEATILEQAKTRFIELLRENNSQLNPAPLSDTPRAGRFAPKFFMQDHRMPNFHKDVYEAAMRELLRERKIEREEYGRPARPNSRLIVAGEGFGGNVLISAET